MLTKNVHYDKQPDNIIIERIPSTYRARIDFPTNIQHILQDDNNYYQADVYSIEVDYTKNLYERVANNYEKWLARAKIALDPTPTLEDAIEAINVLTELVLGGE